MFIVKSVCRATVVILMAFAVTAAVGCGGSSSSNPAAATSSAVNYSGTWSGTTSQRQSITITVSESTVTSITTRVLVSMAGSSCYSDFATSESGTISNGSFRIPIKSVSGVAYSSTIEGTFASATTLSGKINSFDASGLLCSNAFVMGTPVRQSEKTFTATKQ